MSGASTSQWELPPHQINLIEREALLVDCPTNSLVASMIECMQMVSKCIFNQLYLLFSFNSLTNVQRNATEFGKSLINMFEFGEGNPILIWTPVVEPDFGQERFLTDNPTRLFRLGRFHKVPIIAGVTELEFAGFGLSEPY